jgi:hypothetical protein
MENYKRSKSGVCLGLAAVVFGIFTTLAPPLAAQKVRSPRPGAVGEFVLIGTMTADLRADHDSIKVTGPFDGFRRIKLKVVGADLEIGRLIVSYDNGRPEELEVREVIRQGGETRAMDLRGIGKRSINRIDIWYKTKGILKGKATVVVLGMK